MWQAPVGGDGDDEFAKAFGESPTDLPRKPHHSIYIPAAPGQASIPETLSQSDVLEVVRAQLPAIKSCVESAKLREPGVKGRLSIRWVIGVDGKVLKAEIVTEEFKNAYVATCLRALSLTWRFPQHRVQGDAIVFPFTF
jgi:hypothetical protein